MNRSYRTLCLLTVGALVSTATVVHAQDSSLVKHYRFTELKGTTDAQSTRAYALNYTSQIVGWLQNDEEKRHSAHWHNKVVTDLHGTVHFDLEHPLFDVGYHEAYDISNADQIVGTARTEVKCGEVTFIVTHAYVLRPAVLNDLATPYPGDALTNLRTLGCICNNAYDSAATGISNANHVVGWADREDGSIRAFLVVPEGGEWYRDDDGDCIDDLMWNLGTLAASDPVSSATAVNDSGLITGYSYTVGSDGLAGYHAFLVTPLDSDGDSTPDTWYTAANATDDVNILMTDLQTLGGVNSWGRDINNSAQIVGESDVILSTGESLTHAFLWENGTMTDLGTLRSDRAKGFSAASAINNKGAVVGWAENDDGQRRAFIYENGEMKDLNDLLYLVDDEGDQVVASVTLTEARDINNDGVIIGWGTVRGSEGQQERGFLLNPVMIDPTVLQDDDDDTSGSDNADGSSGDGTVRAQPIYGTPQHLRDQSTNDTDDDADTVNTAPTTPSLCGVGTLLAFPLSIVGVSCLKRGRRRWV